jgi:hypothetical protein
MFSSMSPQESSPMRMETASVTENRGVASSILALATAKRLTV